jgi:hypothetical protein
MECSICFNKYDNAQRKPYVINPCGHCFCSKCLAELPSQLCPNDRGKIESKTLNRAILELVEESHTNSKLSNYHSKACTSSNIEKHNFAGSNQTNQANRK